MAAKLTRLTHKTAIRLHLVAQVCTICSSLSRRPVRKFLDTPSYVQTQGEVLDSCKSLKDRLTWCREEAWKISLPLGSTSWWKMHPKPCQLAHTAASLSCHCSHPHSQAFLS